jgi:hypothetical protein
VLTIVVIVADDTLDSMVGVLDQIARHECSHAVEVLVLARDAALADDVARLRPGSFVVAMGEAIPEGSTRNLGLQIARGDYVVFLDAPVTLAPGALDGLIELHDQGHAVVTGETAEPVPSAAGWVTRFLDPYRCSFAREPLLAAGGFDRDQQVGVDVVARERLLRSGHREARCPLISYGCRSGVRRPGDTAARFTSGQAIPGSLVSLVREDVRRVSSAAQRHPDEFARARPQVVGGLLATWAGAAYGHLRRKRT